MFEYTYARLAACLHNAVALVQYFANGESNLTLVPVNELHNDGRGEQTVNQVLKHAERHGGLKRERGVPEGARCIKLNRTLQIVCDVVIFTGAPVEAGDVVEVIY